MRAVAVFGVFLAACSASSGRDAIAVHTPDAGELAFGTAIAATDLAHDLGTITHKTVGMAHLPAACVDGEVHIAVLGHQHTASGAPATTDLAAQSYQITEQRCGTGHLVTVRGGSQLASQWGVYELLERLGVRYFHPERTLYPDALHWPDAPIDARESPGIEQRSLNAHRAHPIELSPPLAPSPGLDMAGYQRRWIDWNVKVRHTTVNGYDESLVGSYAYDRGFPREANIDLLEVQQGGRPVIDPDDPRPEHDQIAAAIDQQMASRAGVPDVSDISFEFNPSEFTTADETLTVDRINFFTQYVNQHYPGVEVQTIDHGTGQPPGPVYGVRFFDLPKFGPPSLAVFVHPLMFYDLDRPAPVYGNQDFAFLRNFLVDQQATRRIYYYPESSWWLTFDQPVPLYLAPVSLEARDHDLQLLRPYIGALGASHGVIGHHTFSSGQEWGYWLLDYCTARMTWDLDLGWTGCLDYVGQSLVGGQDLRDLFVEVARAQIAPLRDPSVLSMLVGSDDQTEEAALTGITLHPLPPAPVDVLGMAQPDAADFMTHSVAGLPAMADQYAGWADRAAQLAAKQGPAQREYLDEIADGLRITGLRAQHAYQVYSSVFGLRAAMAAGDFTQVSQAAAVADQAKATTDAARAIVTAREAGYRYPAELTIAGDEAGTPGAIANQTTYPYRYLSRTHRMFYWTRPDTQLTAMFGFDKVSPNDRILTLGTPLALQLLVDQVSQLAIDWGDGQMSTALVPHSYAAQGVYSWTVNALQPQGAIHQQDQVAIVSRRLAFPQGSLHVIAPAGASLIESLLPGVIIGLGDDAGGSFLALGRTDASDAASATVAAGTLLRRSRADLMSPAQDLSMDLQRVGAITVLGAVIQLGDGTGPTARTIAISGQLATAEVVQILVNTGAFDEPGARSILAATLGYTVATLPDHLPFTLGGTGSEP